MLPTKKSIQNDKHLYLEFCNKEFNNQELFSENLNMQKKLLNNLKQNNLDHEEFSLMIKEIIFARIDELLNLSLKLIDSIKMNKLNEKYKIILIGSGAKIFENNLAYKYKKENELNKMGFSLKNMDSNELKDAVLEMEQYHRNIKISDEQKIFKKKFALLIKKYPSDKNYFGNIFPTISNNFLKKNPFFLD